MRRWALFLDRLRRDQKSKSPRCALINVQVQNFITNAAIFVSIAIQFLIHLAQAAPTLKKAPETKRQPTPAIADYFAMKKAEFDDIDKYQLDEISYSESDENRSQDQSYAQSDAVNRDIMDLSSLLGSVSGVISLDADSMMFEEPRAISEFPSESNRNTLTLFRFSFAARDDLPEFETLSNVPPLASSNDDFHQKLQRQQQQQKFGRAVAHTASPAATRQATRVQRKSHELRKAQEEALESFVFSHYVQPGSVESETRDIPSPSKDGEVGFFAATPAPKTAPVSARAMRHWRRKSMEDVALEKLVFDQFVRLPTGEQ